MRSPQAVELPASVGSQDSVGPGDWEIQDTAFLAALVLLFAASRIAWIVWSPATASYWEESYRWFAAHELSTGPTLAFFDYQADHYQADHYQGGSLLVILLALPFFAIAGELADVVAAIREISAVERAPLTRFAKAEQTGLRAAAKRNGPSDP